MLIAPSAKSNFIDKQNFCWCVLCLESKEERKEKGARAHLNKISCQDLLRMLMCLVELVH
jgi:predicted adenine nucleotide alpha hydrolase (AANH) superfamily ATPase